MSSLLIGLFIFGVSELRCVGIRERRLTPSPACIWTTSNKQAEKRLNNQLGGGILLGTPGQIETRKPEEVEVPSRIFLSITEKKSVILKNEGKKTKIAEFFSAILN